LGHSANCSADAAVHFVCAALESLCVRKKHQPEPGSFYPSGYELVFVFKVGKGRHINNVRRGRHRRKRSDVWDYVSESALGRKPGSQLALGGGPDAKPIAMIRDAIEDCSNRGGLILNPFGGAGTTLIAAPGATLG
jgi:DNA modification methylase